jgi:hypothetical protein
MFFAQKVETVSADITNAAPPVIRRRFVGPLSRFQPMTIDEAAKLLARAPTKSCQLDPVPTWLVKQAFHLFAPIVATELELVA